MDHVNGRGNPENWTWDKNCIRQNVNSLCKAYTDSAGKFSCTKYKKHQRSDENNEKKFLQDFGGISKTNQACRTPQRPLQSRSELPAMPESKHQRKLGGELFLSSRAFGKYRRNCRWWSFRYSSEESGRAVRYGPEYKAISQNVYLRNVKISQLEWFRSFLEFHAVD